MEELEDALLELCAGRAEAHAARCAAESADAYTAAEAAVSAAVGVLSRGGAPDAAADAAGAAADAAEARLATGGGLPEELDEFGRDLNAERRHAAARRCGGLLGWLLP